MGLARLLNRAATSPNQHSATPVRGGSGPTQFMAGPEQRWASPATLPPPSEADAMGVPAFWKCHAYVTGTVGMLPAVAYRGTDAIDPQPPVILQPDPTQTPMAFWAGVTSSLTLYGNSICLITSTDRLGWPATLKPIHPTLAAVRFTGNPMAPDIAAWYLAGQMYDPSQVWHVKSHLGRAGWPLGRGVMDTNGDAIAIGLALQTYAASYFNSGGMPIGILKIHRPEITQAQADQAKSDWISKFSGAPTPAVLNELTDFTPLAYRPVDSQMVESRQFELKQIANMWGIPGSKVGADSGGGTYKNAEMEEVQARNDAIAPWTALLEQAGSLELLPRGQRLVWDLSAALRTDTLSQYQAYQAALGGPGPMSQWMLIDEIRARENLDPMADAAADIAAESPASEVGEAGLAMPGTAPAPPAGPPASPPAGRLPAMPALAGGPPAANQFPMMPAAAPEKEAADA